jgi:flagellar biosynthetic protein FliR
MMQESLVGLALGLAARLIYLAVGQGGIIAAQQMGFTDAEVFDPTNEVESQPIAMLFEIIFLLLFLSAGGHRLLLGVLNSSLYSFPVASLPDLASLAEGIVQAGSAMLLFALKLAAPMLAGFLLVAVLLCILARVLPEMDILMSSFPLRVGAGFLLAGMIMPLMNAFTQELAQWMGNFLAI